MSISITENSWPQAHNCNLHVRSKQEKITRNIRNGLPCTHAQLKSFSKMAENSRFPHETFVFPMFLRETNAISSVSQVQKRNFLWLTFAFSVCKISGASFYNCVARANQNGGWKVFNLEGLTINSVRLGWRLEPFRLELTLLWYKLQCFSNVNAN